MTLVTRVKFQKEREFFLFYKYFTKYESSRGINIIVIEKEKTSAHSRTKILDTKYRRKEILYAIFLNKYICESNVLLYPFTILKKKEIVFFN